MCFSISVCLPNYDFLNMRVMATSKGGSGEYRKVAKVEMGRIEKARGKQSPQ